MRNIDFVSIAGAIACAVLGAFVMNVSINWFLDRQAGNIAEALDELYESKCVADDGTVIVNEYCTGVDDAWAQVDSVI
jgi:hypothetical protein